MSDLCPCNSNLTYADCCGRYHQGTAAPTPEALMRSRYSAYAKGLFDYIGNTMQGPAAHGFDAERAAHAMQTVSWTRLHILATTANTVEFAAFYEQMGKSQLIRECSQFEKVDDRWYYTNGKTIKTGPNEPCVCGSQRKYKKCCG